MTLTAEGKKKRKLQKKRAKSFTEDMQFIKGRMEVVPKKVHIPVPNCAKKFHTSIPIRLEQETSTLKAALYIRAE